MPGFQKICSVQADLSSQSGKLQPRRGRYGAYYPLLFDVGMYFGSTALEARVMWKENVGVINCLEEHVYSFCVSLQGKLCSGPAAVVPEEFM